MPAKRGLGHAQRHAHQNICAIALKDRMRPYRDIHIKITRRRAALPGLTLTAQADSCAIINAGRHRDIQAAFALHAPGTTANLARVLDGSSNTAAGWAGALHQEKPLLRPDLAAALAGAAGLHARCRASFSTNALTSLTGNAGGKPDGLLRPGKGFFQRNLHLRA